jgi:hypothetical protein
MRIGNPAAMGAAGAATAGATGAVTAGVGAAAVGAVAAVTGLDMAHAALQQDLFLSDWQPTSRRATTAEMNGTHELRTKRFTFCIYFSLCLEGLQPSI